MVAIIKTGKGIRRCFQYNENKVNEGIAKLLLAQNYPKETSQLNFFDRLKMLEKTTELNSKTKVNSVHISLNFDPSEILSKEKLEAIATKYMEGIGFGNQPYLVYQHHDAGHPHLHIVTTNIQADGSRISLHHLGIHKSEPTRKAIEKSFGLIQAEAQKKKLFTLKPIPLHSLKYGKIPTKRAINSILQGVIFNYKYTSIPELNAVLNLYHVKADRGKEHSIIFKNQGLVYQIIDANGNGVGVPIKASSFSNQPTLKMLEHQFKKNEKERIRWINASKSQIDWALNNHKIKTISAFKEALKDKGIDVVLRQNDQGVLYGITYVNHLSKCVFNGSTLGKAYSIKAINERLDTPSPKIISKEQKAKILTIQEHNSNNDNHELTTHSTELLNVLFRAENNFDPIPYPLKGKKKKKKRIHKPSL